MIYQQLQFQGLPFRPDDKQVFYIEGTYDLQYNRLFEVEYQRISDAFQSHGLQFYYLPKLFRTAGIEQKIRYYAPYLSEKIMAVKRIESNAMLQFLTNRNQVIEPSLIFSARNSFDDNTTTFLQLPLSEVCKDNVDIVESIISGIRKVNEEWLSAHIGQLFETNGLFRESSTPEPPKSSACYEYYEPDYRDRVHMRKMSKAEQFRLVEEEQECQERLCEEKSSKQHKKSLTERFMDFFSSSNDEDVCNSASVCEEPAIDPEEERSLIDTERILRELRENVQKLRLEGVSLMAIHEFIDKQEPLSRMVITEDYRIFLPDYNNMEIEMGALPKAVYFLFLRYPEGIIYKHMPDYYNELLGIYKQLRPNTDEARLNLTVTKVVNPLGNALNENIARIRKAFIDKFDEHLANNYIITGERGLQYFIPLDRELITWEE